MLAIARSLTLSVLTLSTLTLSACGEPERQSTGKSSAPPHGREASTGPIALIQSASPLSLTSHVSAGASREDERNGETVDWNASGPLTGTWKGSWAFYGREVEGAARIELRHYDESFNGSIEMTPDLGAVCGKTSGTIVYGQQVDDYVTFGFYDIYSYGFTFHGTVKGNELRGEFVAINACGAESGTFSITL